MPSQPTKNKDAGGAPPENRGPVLEVHGEDRLIVLLSAGILVGLYVVALRISQGDWDWLEDPVHWALMSLLAVFTIARDWKTHLVAGADWLRVNRRWVDTYDLTHIRLRGVWFGWMLRLQDSEGRPVRTYLTNIEANRDLWALVYNGLAHSVQNGAEINNLAAAMLQLHPGLTSIRGQVHRPKIPDRTVWTFLLIISVVFGAIYLFRPDLLGPALMTLTGLVLVAMAVLGTLLYLARRRENAIDNQRLWLPRQHEDQ